MYLVDTSVWIDYFNEVDNRSTEKLEYIFNHDIEFGITAVIYQEILQGAATTTDFAKLETYLKTQCFYHPLNLLESYTEAARLYFDCRRRGVTVRSTIDCLIARIAIEHNLILLHNDRDFQYIGQIIPELKQEST